MVQARFKGVLFVAERLVQSDGISLQKNFPPPRSLSGTLHTKTTLTSAPKTKWVTLPLIYVNFKLRCAL